MNGLMKHITEISIDGSNELIQIRQNFTTIYARDPSFLVNASGVTIMTSLRVKNGYNREAQETNTNKFINACIALT